MNKDKKNWSVHTHLTKQGREKKDEAYLRKPRARSQKLRIQYSQTGIAYVQTIPIAAQGK